MTTVIRLRRRRRNHKDDLIMFNKIWQQIINHQPAAADSRDASVEFAARQLMENAERYAGRTPHYASELRRAAQAQLTLDSYIA
jgi:hypothetical protein